MLLQDGLAGNDKGERKFDYGVESEGVDGFEDNLRSALLLQYKKSEDDKDNGESSPGLFAILSSRMRWYIRRGYRSIG